MEKHAPGYNAFNQYVIVRSFPFLKNKPELKCKKCGEPITLSKGKLIFSGILCHIPFLLPFVYTWIYDDLRLPRAFWPYRVLYMLGGVVIVFLPFFFVFVSETQFILPRFCE